VAHDAWNDVLNATAFANRCPQLDGTGTVIGKEDCLYLNIWAPADPQPAALPVMFYLHGGGHTAGYGASGSPGPFDGQAFLEQFGAMVVTIDYRLHVFGNLALPALDAESDFGVSGNYGFLDEIAALQWVQHNIAAFGGDPRRVMLFGFSAGGQDVALHLVSPLSKGLFASAMMESPAPALEMPTLIQVEQTTGASVANITACGAAADLLGCLRALPSERVMAAVPGLSNFSRQTYGPNIDGYAIPDAPLKRISAGLLNAVPVIVGSSADEYYLNFTPGTVPDESTYLSEMRQTFGQSLGDLAMAQYPSAAYPSPERAYVAAVTDNLVTCPVRTLARTLATAQTPPVFRYFFTHSFGPGTALSQRHAFHGADQYFEWRDLATLQAQGYSPSDSERALVDAMQGYWSRFTSGDPNGGGAIAWPAYSPFNGEQYLRFDDQIVVDYGVRSQNCDFWDGHPELSLWR
jgi:para-nitrobenzyl esterase